MELIRGPDHEISIISNFDAPLITLLHPLPGSPAYCVTLAMVQLGQPGRGAAEQLVHHLHTQPPGLSLTPEQRQACTEQSESEGGVTTTESRPPMRDQMFVKNSSKKGHYRGCLGILMGV